MLEDPDSLASDASQADAVIHAASDPDFSRFVEKDRRVIGAMAGVLVCSGATILIGAACPS